jgi:hypothetical protein
MSDQVKETYAMIIGFVVLVLGICLFCTIDTSDMEICVKQGCSYYDGPAAQCVCQGEKK